MSGTSLRLGIIGTGRIANRFADTWRTMSDDEVRGASLTVVYNPHADSSGRFAKAHDISLHTDDLSVFLSAVDAVYIASPHETHASYARSALTAGKHVLCEKPMAFSRTDAEGLFALARDTGMVLMEAVKTAYLPGFLAILDTVCSGKIGEIVDIEAAFTRLTPTNVRELTDLTYGGSFTELASYGLLPVLMLFGNNWRDVILSTRDAANGLDLYSKAVFDYGDRMATVKAGLGVKSEGQLLISGTKGYLLAESPWWLTKKFVVRYEDPGKIERYAYPFDGTGMQYEISAFLASCLEGGGTDPEDLPPQVSIASAAVMERFLEGMKDARSRAKDRLDELRGKVRIWAHRGCSNAFPENTLQAFLAAAMLGKALTGIELDVQRTSDGKLVVIHDETVDRVTTSTGAVRDLTMDELGKLGIPSFEEVLDALSPYCRENGLRINVELKTGIVRYEGIERAAWEAVHERGLDRYIVWSSFLADSIRIIREIDPGAETGMLSRELEDCIRRGDEVGCNAYHPSIAGLACAEASRVNGWQAEGRIVRAYNGIEPLYGSGKVMPDVDLRDYAAMGVTDIFTNVPERYV